MRSAFALGVISVLFLPALAHAQTLFGGLGVEEYQPRIPFSGRVDAVAIDPDEDDHVLAATESGGLFQSLDGGNMWRHVDSLPAMDLRDVHFIPEESGTWILVTAEADFENRSASGPAGTVVSSNGGIWISRDGGITWIHPDSAVPRANVTPPEPIICPPDVSAFGADYDTDSDRVFVATDCGVSFSDDAGVSWEHVFFDIKGKDAMDHERYRRFVTVAALDGRGVVLGGRDGVWFSEKNGENGSWFRETTGIGLVAFRDSHAAGRVNGAPDAAYIIVPDSDGFRSLWRTADMGRTWVIRRNDPPKPDSLGCGGIAHVYAFFFSDWLPEHLGDVELVFYGNSCLTYFLQGRGTGAVELEGSHADTRALAFNPGTSMPRYLASDGGLDRSRVGPYDRPRAFWNRSNWDPIGSGPGKINALQLYDVAGQAVIGTDEYRLAIGTQDNKLWSSNDDGRTWPESQSAEPEGGNIQMQRAVVPGERDKWTYWRCAKCKRKFSDPLFQNTEDWPGNSSRSGCGLLKFGKFPFADGTYASVLEPKFKDDGSTDCYTRTPTIELTTDHGNSYTRLLTLTSRDEMVQGVPQVGFSAYFPIARGNYSVTATNGNDGSWPTRDIRFVRIDNIFFPPSSNRFPAMNNCDPNPALDPFGSLGQYGYNYEWPAVFGADPFFVGTIIAPDVRFDRMMITRNGGECWSEMPGLPVNKLTQNGKYKFSWANAMYEKQVFSLVSAVSFFPDNPELVVLGMQQGGIYLSGDRGGSWSLVPGSESVQNITAFHWKSANEIYVASFGRGLWKVSYVSSFDLDDLIPVLSGNTGPSGFVNGLNVGDDLVVASLTPRASGRSTRVTPAGKTPTDKKGLLGVVDLDPVAPPDSPSDTPVSLLQALLDQQLLDTVVLVVDGHITRVRKVKNRDIALTDLIQVSAGASLLAFAPQGPIITDNPQIDPRPELLMNDRDAAVLQQRFLNPPKVGGSKVLGLGYKGDKFVGVILGSGITYADPVPSQTKFPPEVPSNPPAYDGPYVTVSASSPGIAYSSGDTILLRGYDFESPAPIEIILDNLIVASQITPDKIGQFETFIKLENLTVGQYELVVRQPATQQEDVQTIVIMHND